LIGAAAGSVVTATFMGVAKLIPVITKAVRPNGNGKKITTQSNNMKPGSAAKCIEHGEKIVEHDTTIKYLASESVESKKDREAIKNKLDSGFQRIYDKLDGK